MKAFALANSSFPLQRVLYPDFQTEVKGTEEAMCCSRVGLSANFCSKTKESDNQLNQSPIAHSKSRTMQSLLGFGGYKPNTFGCGLASNLLKSLDILADGTLAIALDPDSEVECETKIWRDMTSAFPWLHLRSDESWHHGIAAIACCVWQHKPRPSKCDNKTRCHSISFQERAFEVALISEITQSKGFSI